VGPVYRGHPEDARLLAGCYTRSLELAAERGLRSVALPAISCGVYGYPLEEACRIAVDTTLAFLADHPAIERILFVLFSESDRQVYERYLQRLA
jgi:O-acetyl-ADP-ribose deacetylase (regulator of RNase III)